MGGLLGSAASKRVDGAGGGRARMEKLVRMMGRFGEAWELKRQGLMDGEDGV
jgi:hypothetical protein